MEFLALHTGAPTLKWKDNKSFIYVVEAKRVTPIVKQIDIPVFSTRTFDNDALFPNMKSILSCS